jgi:hypothetical protein
MEAAVANAEGEEREWRNAEFQRLFDVAQGPDKKGSVDFVAIGERVAEAWGRRKEQVAALQAAAKKLRVAMQAGRDALDAFNEAGK